MDLFKVGFVAVRLVDIIDVSLATLLFFKLYQSLRGQISLRILGLVLGVFALWKIVQLLEFRLIKTILDEFLGLGAIAVVVLFAPEIRTFLRRMSKNTLLDRLLRSAQTQSAEEGTIQELVEALKSIRATGTGALIAIKGKDPILDIVETGDELDANVSSRLIYTIFQKESPLHDGAMIVEGNKIRAVRAILPISKRSNLEAELGLRHRSAVGLSEVSDALVIVASEERREISLARRGELQRGVDYQEVEAAIRRHQKGE